MAKTLKMVKDMIVGLRIEKNITKKKIKKLMENKLAKITTNNK